MRRRLLLAGMLLVVLAAGAVWLLWRTGVIGSGSSQSNVLIREFLLNPDRRAALGNDALTQCPDAPFVLPSSGMIGLMYADTAAPYSDMRQHTGIDLFGDGEPGAIPVYSVYDGWLTRRDDWLSTVILRHDDPLQPGRRIWTYYTHMASRDGSASYVATAFAPGTTDLFLPQGTLLGYQGEYAGAGGAIALHLHFSIVVSDDAGAFRNESVLTNTLDPSPYFGMALHLADEPQPRPVECR